MKYLEATVTALLNSGAATATKYISPKEVIRVTRTRIRGGIKRLFAADGYDLRVTIGKPNYHARQFIAKCKKAGEPFPVKKVQLAFIDPKRTNKRAILLRSKHKKQREARRRKRRA